MFLSVSSFALAVVVAFAVAAKPTVSGSFSSFQVIVLWLPYEEGVKLKVLWGWEIRDTVN